MPRDKDIGDLLDAARRAGATVSKTGSGHWRITGPDGQQAVCAQTPSDARSIRNVRAEFRRKGILEPPTRATSLTKIERAFLAAFDAEGKCRGFGTIPPRLEASGLIRVSNRYRGGKANGWMAWLTDRGRALIAMSESEA
jgi:hypothetical protein